MFCIKQVQKNFAKFNGEHLCRNLLFNKVVSVTIYFNFSFTFKLFFTFTSSYSFRSSRSPLFFRNSHRKKRAMEFFSSKVAGCNFTLKGLHYGFFPVNLRNFSFFCRILSVEWFCSFYS